MLRSNSNSGVEYLQIITSSVQHIVNSLTADNRKKWQQNKKHRSVNNVFWRVVAGRIERGRGPDAARGPPVGQSCATW